MRNERMNIYVTDDEKEIIDQNARAYGMTRSEYLRHVALCFDEECDDSEKLHADFLLLCERIHKLTKDRLRIPLWMTVLRSLKIFSG